MTVKTQKGGKLHAWLGVRTYWKSERKKKLLLIVCERDRAKEREGWGRRRERGRKEREKRTREGAIRVVWQQREEQWEWDRDRHKGHKDKKDQLGRAEEQGAWVFQTSLSLYLTHRLSTHIALIKPHGLKG